MFADLLALKPAPIVGARIVRPMGRSDSEAEKLSAAHARLARFDRLMAAQLVARRKAHASDSISALAAAQRECRRIKYHIRKIRKQIAKLEAE